MPLKLTLKSRAIMKNMWHDFLILKINCIKQHKHAFPESKGEIVT